MPMRSVPHRVVCLLGLDDGAFPRSAGVDGDDALARDPCVGERDLRSEDRQLLLDAMLAAQEHLVILYTGADPRTNAHRPPAVPIGEILDAVDATVRTTDGRPAREFVVVRHPLQAFDARNFTPGALGVPGPFSFDHQALHGARRAASAREEPRPFLPGPLPDPEETGDLELAELVAFLEHPARAFLRQRLGVSLRSDEEEIDDALSVELDPLQTWAVGDRLVQARLAGADAESCQQAEWRRGTLPPGALGWRVLQEVGTTVERLVAAGADRRRAPPRAVDVTVDLGGRRLVGTVGAVHGDTVVRVEYSKLAAKHRLRAWAQLLVLAAHDPRTRWTAVTIGRGKGSGVARSTLGPVPAGDARARLAELVDLRARGLCAPLPMGVTTSEVYATKRVGGMTETNAQAAAMNDWNGSFAGRADAAHAMVWGAGAPFAELLAQPCPDEERWPVAESTRFGFLARRLWDPLLAVETTDGT
jgi:exodeoxyribonuclease V gamma subunit